MTEKTAKELARRIDPTYFRDVHRLRRLRFLLSVGLFLVAVVWIVVAALLGDESAYAAGPVAQGHVRIEEDCSTCHTLIFDSVPDSACLGCHETGPHATEMNDPACGTCHADHRGRVGLTAVEDAFCNACHQDHSRITSFGRHLRFKVEPTDQHLKSSHAKHMVPDLVGGPLHCASCHEADPSGRAFEPIRFASHCERCHKETVDAELKDEVVPHGLQADELEDFVAAVYLRRTRADEAVVERVARRTLLTRERAEILGQRTRAAVEALFAPGRERGCLLCHVADQMRIQPLQIPERWMPKAVFDHAAHASERCDRCHATSSNNAAETLALPGLGHCRECHHDGGARTTCVTCHAYHIHTRLPR
ncbi:MAG: cytochrome c3 family protein [Planctomycetota bacterium]|jgi:hypothetical protein